MLALARLRPLRMTRAREHALPAAATSSPFRRDPKLRQAGSTPKHSRLVTQGWSAGACALATALDDACSGTCPSSRGYEFPVPARSKAPASRKHSKHSRLVTQVWSAGACALATALDDARSGTRPPSRSYEFPFRRDPKLRQAGSTPNIAVSLPKYLECWHSCTLTAYPSSETVPRP